MSSTLPMAILLYAPTVVSVLPTVRFIVCLSNVAVKEVPMDVDVLCDEYSTLRDKIKGTPLLH